MRKRPDGAPILVLVPMPRDTNGAGDVFGGWIMAQMDLAGAVVASRRAAGRVATVAADQLGFHRPVSVGDLVSFHAATARVGRTSLAVAIEVWARCADGAEHRVAGGVFTYVKIGPDRRPVLVPPEP